MNYVPASTPMDDKGLREFLTRELNRISTSVRDDTSTVFYRTNMDTELSLSAGDSANYKAAINANVLRFSTSNTITITGVADKTPFRERVFINVGTGVLVLKSEGTESSATFRFALSAPLWQLSANAAAICWYDPVSSRLRGISRTP